MGKIEIRPCLCPDEDRDDRRRKLKALIEQARELIATYKVYEFNDTTNWIEPIDKSDSRLDVCMDAAALLPKLVAALEGE